MFGEVREKIGLLLVVVPIILLIVTLFVLAIHDASQGSYAAIYIISTILCICVGVYLVGKD